MKAKYEKGHAKGEADDENADGIDDVLQQRGARVLLVSEYPRGGVDPAGEGCETAAEGGGERRVQRGQAAVVEGLLLVVCQQTKYPAARSVAEQRGAIIPAVEAQSLGQQVQADARTNSDHREEEKDLILNDFND